MKIQASFYQREDVVSIARSLIGKVLYSKHNGEITGAIITETEAYNGVADKASHAYGGRRTSRTEIMYHAGGVSYVYLCYGIHFLFNVVTGKSDNPQAVLIRGIQPVCNKQIIFNRRGLSSINKTAFQGPGKVTRALGITLADNGVALTGNRIWIEDKGIKVPAGKITETPRIGVDYAGKDALLPYRFFTTADFEQKLKGEI